MPSRDKFLENLAKHFGVNRNINIKWRRLLYCEVVMVQEAVMSNDTLEGGVWDRPNPLIQQPAFKEAAIEKRNGSKPLIGLAVLLRQTREEQPAKSFVVEQRALLHCSLIHRA